MASLRKPAKPGSKASLGCTRKDRLTRPRFEYIMYSHVDHHQETPATVLDEAPGCQELAGELVQSDLFGSMAEPGGRPQVVSAHR